MPSAQLYMAPQQVQTQTASLRLQHAVRLLQMSSQDFRQSIDQALHDNPFLDGDGDGDDDELPQPLQALSGDLPLTAAEPPQAEEAPPATADASDVPGEDGLFETAPAEDWGTPGSGEGSGVDALDLTAAGVTLAGHLHAQLNVQRLAPRELALAKLVVELLDEDGYLRSDPAEALAAVEAGGSDAVQARADELQRAVERVQALDPAGVGARSVQECLLLQLPGVECAEQRALMRAILTDHLPKLALRELPAIARTLRQPLPSVEAACARIRRLDPRPGWRFGAAAAAYITPDVIVQRHKGRWRVLLNPAVVPRVRLNRQIVELYRGGRATPNAKLTSHLQEARWTLRNVEQRFCTIVAVAEAIVQRQQQFLDFGELAMKPLGLREIAEAVGVHESTVSRVTSNKYIATPVGVFELKHFFSRAMVMPSGNACSSTAIRRLVREMIDAEPAGKPLTDAALADNLKQQGFVLARRTVTKYRQAMRIDTASRRVPSLAAQVN